MARVKPLKIEAEIGSDDPRIDHDIYDVKVEAYANPTGPGLIVEFDAPVRCLRLTSASVTALSNLLSLTPFRH
jgi:hypothetical protein